MILPLESVPFREGDVGNSKNASDGDTGDCKPCGDEP